MKKTKSAVILLIIAVVVAIFVACSSKPAYSDKEVELTQVVTDANGEAVTDANGEVVTEKAQGVTVTDVNGQTVTEVVTKKDGTEVTKPNGEKVTQAVTVAPSQTTKNNSTNSNDKTTSSTTTKKNDKTTTTTKKNTATTTTTETTTLPPTTAVGQDEVEDKDIQISVVLPYYSNEDAHSYELIVTIGKNKLKYPINDGCRGQKIEITVPKEYKGKNAKFSIDVFGKEYALEGTIKAGTKIQFETIIIVTGEDD